MHCDEERMIHVYRQEILRTWDKLRGTDYGDPLLLDELVGSIKEYRRLRKDPKG